jgi:hypothetical protein
MPRPSKRKQQLRANGAHTCTAQQATRQLQDPFLTINLIDFDSTKAPQLFPDSLLATNLAEFDLGKEYESANLPATNFVDHDLSEGYKSDNQDSESSVSSDNKVLEVDDMELNDNEHASSIFKLLLSTSEKSFDKQGRPL